MKTNPFDIKAADWDKRTRSQEISAIFVNELKNNIDQNSSITAMEFGCGTGLAGMQLYSYFDQLYMLDNSLGMLNVLKEKISTEKAENIHTIFGDIFKLEIAKNQFDLIYTVMSFHHVENTEKLTSRFAELLKPGGKLCIADLESEDGSFHHDGDVPHFGFDTKKLEKLLNKYQLATEKSYRMHIIEKEDINGNLREYPMFLLEAVKIR